MPLSYFSTSFTVPSLAPGNYLHTGGQNSNSTSAALGTGSLRIVPWLIHQPVTIDRIGAEVTLIGDAGSKLRIGIYADNGARYPGSLLLDAGTINGDSATIQEITLSPLTLNPGLYYVGGAVQIVTTTQPTMRTIGTWTPPVITSIGTANTNVNNALGYFQSGVTGALPSVFTTTVSLAASAPRIFVRTA